MNTIQILVEMSRWDDGTYSLSLENEAIVEANEEHYFFGLSEGDITDHVFIARAAGRAVTDYLETRAWRTLPENAVLAARTPWSVETQPVEFKRDES